MLSSSSQNTSVRLQQNTSSHDNHVLFQQFHKGPSIFDVHTEGARGVRLRWMHVDGGRGVQRPAPCGRPHRKLKLESTDVILSSSHAKKFAFFLPEFRLWTEKSGNFSAI